MHIDQSTVTKALKRVGEKHHQRFMADIQRYKLEQASAIEAAAYNALNQYFKSQQQLQIVRKTGRIEKGQFVGKVQTTIEKFDQYGDSKLLAMFYKGMEDVRKIWGFDSKSTPTGGVNGINTDNMTVDEKVALFVSIPLEKRLEVLATMLTTNNTAQANPDDSGDSENTQ